MRQILLDLGDVNLFFFHVPIRIFGYGLMLVLGFLLGIGAAQWRARRAGEDPAAVSYVGILALIGGILGARIAFVIKDWDNFAGKGLGTLLDFTSGGLIYYGGLGLGIATVIVYLVVARLPVRRYLDIVAVSLMIGLAFGRAGCLLNGCCYGGRCDAHWALGTTFPMFSKPLVKFDGRDNPYSRGTSNPTPVFAHQMDPRHPLVEVDERLHMVVPGAQGASPQPGPLHAPQYLHGALTGDQLAVLLGEEARWRELYNTTAGRDGLIDREEWDKALARGDGLLRGSEHWDEADADENGQVSFKELQRCFETRRRWVLEKFAGQGQTELAGPAREAAQKYLQADELAMAAAQQSLPVQPAQALGIANALMLAVLLWFFHPMRRREGQAFALLMVLYPIIRFVEEAIRDDNPHDLAAGLLTHNQWTCVVLFGLGAVLMVVLWFFPPSAGPFALQRSGDYRTDRNRIRRSGEPDDKTT